MPCSLTICFAHATALAMSFSINSEKEMVRNEDNIHRNFIISLSSISFVFLGWAKNNQNFVFYESMYLWMLRENSFFFHPIWHLLKQLTPGAAQWQAGTRLNEPDCRDIQMAKGRPPESSELMTSALPVRKSNTILVARCADTMNLSPADRSWTQPWDPTPWHLNAKADRA